MELYIIGFIIVGIFAAYFLYNKSSANKVNTEIIERRKNFVSSKSPTARVIVNNGTHLFYIDSEQGYFGVDETDKTYDLENMQSVNIYKEGISIIHNTTFLYIGREPSRANETTPLDSISISLIAAVVLPVLRENLHKKLVTHGIEPTLEYEHDGTICGCDLSSKVFYTTFGSISLYDFSALRSVKVEDLSNNTLYDGNYIIRIAIKTDFSWDDEIDFTFYSKNKMFYDLLTMFKEIKKRGYR